jgi:hypothetical protein
MGFIMNTIVFFWAIIHNHFGCKNNTFRLQLVKNSKSFDKISDFFVENEQGIQLIIIFAPVFRRECDSPAGIECEINNNNKVSPCAYI